MKIVLFSGKAGVGKTTCAKELERFIQGNDKTAHCIVLPFAKKVKQIARQFDWDENKDEKGRKLLQGVGNIGREYDKDIFVRHTWEFIESFCYNSSTVLIDDWRFPNELVYLTKSLFRSEYFDEKEIYTVRIIAPELELLKGTEQYNDPSETALLGMPDSKFSAVFYNEKPMENVVSFTHALYDIIFNEHSYNTDNKLVYNYKF